MKLVRHGEPGAEQAGMIDETGALRDLSTIVGDWSYLTLTPESLTKIKTLDPVSLSKLPEDTRLGPPHTPTRKNCWLCPDLWQTCSGSWAGAPRGTHVHAHRTERYQWTTR